MQAGQSMILRREIDGLDGLEATFCATRTPMSHDDEDVGSYGTSEGKIWRLRTGTAGVKWTLAQDCS